MNLIIRAKGHANFTGFGMVGLVWILALLACVSSPALAAGRVRLNCQNLLSRAPLRSALLDSFTMAPVKRTYVLDDEIRQITIVTKRYFRDLKPGPRLEVPLTDARLPLISTRLASVVNEWMHAIARKVVDAAFRSGVRETPARQVMRFDRDSEADLTAADVNRVAESLRRRGACERTAAGFRRDG